MRVFLGRFIGSFIFFAVGCSGLSISHQEEIEDKFLWLEEISSPRVDAWTKERNLEVRRRFQSTTDFKTALALNKEILKVGKKIPDLQVIGDYFYTLYKNDSKSYGRWVRSLRSRPSGTIGSWETVLDIDQLRRREKRDLVFSFAKCLPPEGEICLIGLSKKGGDSVEIREFHVKKRAFVKDGFFIPQGRSKVSWIDSNHIALAMAEGSGSRTKSGMGRFLKIVSRGSSISKSKVVVQVPKDYLTVYSGTAVYGSSTVAIALRYKSDQINDSWIVTDRGSFHIPVPDGSKIWGISEGQIIVSLRKDLQTSKKSFFVGDLIALPVKDVFRKLSAKSISANLVYRPIKSEFIGEKVLVTKNFIAVDILKNVSGRVLFFQKENGTYRRQGDGVGEGDHSTLLDGSYFSNAIYLQSDSFLEPPKIVEHKLESRSSRVLFTAEKAFNAAGMKVMQKWASSSDGTKIPYFVVGKKPFSGKGPRPLVLDGYGGFGINVLPEYLKFYGKSWLEKGGVYVLANIRGGAEFGEKWHTSAKFGNRKRAFEDFIAVAESLITEGITSASKLGIYGASNGGLLVGAVMVRRPDLFKAVVASVPVLDMIRYPKLLVGAAWIGEYGDPDDSKARRYLLEYSPYHNLKQGIKYPSTLGYASASDDRVHPAHARKMIEKMRSFGARDAYYYESSEGGHFGVSTIEKRAHKKSLVTEFFSQELGL